jgi:hypothetical protein
MSKERGAVKLRNLADPGDWFSTQLPEFLRIMPLGRLGGTMTSGGIEAPPALAGGRADRRLGFDGNRQATED